MDDRQWFDDALESRPSIGAVSVGGVRVAWRAWGGSGLPGIVLVHGGGAHSAWWDHVGPHLAADTRVVALDLSGHGDSGRRSAYDVDTWSLEVLAIAESAGIVDPPVLIGHSLGGFVCLRAAARSVPGVAGVVTVDLPLRWAGEAEQLLRRRFASRSPRVYPTRPEAEARWRPSPDQDVLPYVREHVASESVRPVEGGWTWKFDAVSFQRPQSTPDDLVPLACPSIHIRAGNGMLSEEMAKVLVDRIGPAASVVEIPSAGHHIMLDRPVDLVYALGSATAKFR